MIRAIVADDEPAVSSIISHFIESEDLPITIVAKAGNGRAALKFIRELKPDIVFIDVQMPLATGLEVMRQETAPRYIVITAYDNFAYAQEALRLGACDILLKPIALDQFLEAVNRALGYQFTASPLVNQTLDYINRNYAKSVRLDELSKMFFTTSSHLDVIFKKYTGFSVITYLHKTRINKAKIMLGEQRMSIKETAFEIGYQSLNNFYRYFKKFTGSTPLSFIKGKIRE
jgi:YesN/AraC family two-component response regulator